MATSFTHDSDEAYGERSGEYVPFRLPWAPRALSHTPTQRRASSK
jgi:hypothetical protein